jgi:hypothetical protein
VIRPSKTKSQRQPRIPATPSIPEMIATQTNPSQTGAHFLFSFSLTTRKRTAQGSRKPVSTVEYSIANGNLPWFVKRGE